MAYPRYQYKLSFEYLLDNGDREDDIQTLMGFYNRVGGSFDNFLLLDPSDNITTNQVFAIGDGVNTKYRLVKNYGGFIEPIYGVDTSTVKTYVNGALTSSSVSVEATVTFSSPPAVGKELSWSGRHYYRVIFDEDSNDFDRILSGLWELQSIKLLSVREGS
jgi:hypothetical protein